MPSLSGAITNGQIASSGEEKRETLGTVGGNVATVTMEKLKIEPPYDPIIPLLDVYI